MTDTKLHGLIRESGLPGVVCAAAGPEALIDESLYGTVAFGSEVPMNLDTTFWIASITKLVTAVAILQLAERGALALDDDVAQYLPWFRNVHVLSDTGPVPARTRVQVHHLLTHTAGFAYETWSARLAAFVEAQGLAPGRSGKLASLERPLLFEPGSQWNYGIGMDWAGLFVEKVSGMSLADYLQRHVFDPLGMHSTGFAPATGLAQAVLSARGADGSLSSMPSAPNPEREFDSGGAGLYSTPRDVLRLLQSILRADHGIDGEVLRPLTVREARRNQIGALDVNDLPTCAPERSMDLAPFAGKRRKWSYFGLLHAEAEAGGRSAGSVSWAGVANTYFWVDFDASLAAVVFAQSLPFLDPAVARIVTRYEQSLYAKQALRHARR